MPRPMVAPNCFGPPAQPEAFDEEIRRWESDPRTRGWAETLRELRDESVARLTIQGEVERDLG